jgi:hypothetical protein
MPTATNDRRAYIRRRPVEVAVQPIPAVDIAFESGLDDDAEFQSGHFPWLLIHFDMQSLWAAPPPVADSEH